VEDEGVNGRDVLRGGLQLGDGGDEGGNRPLDVLQQHRLVPQLPAQAHNCSKIEVSIGDPVHMCGNEWGRVGFGGGGGNAEKHPHPPSPTQA